MRVFFTFMLVFVASASASYVHEGTIANFKDLTRGPLTLIHFYHSKSEECAQLDLTWREASKVLKETLVSFVRVDSIEHPELSSECNVNDHPTLKVFRHRQMFDYPRDLGRSLADVVAFVRRELAPPLVEFATPEALHEFLIAHHREQNSTVAVVLSTAKKDDDASVGFLMHAKEFKASYVFAVLYREGPSQVVMHKFFHDEPPEAIYQGPLNSKSKFGAWLEAESLPLLGRITEGNSKRYRARNLPFAWLFYDRRDITTTHTMGQIREVAKVLRGNMSFVLVDVTDPAKRESMRMVYGLTGETLPALALELPGQLISAWPEDRSFDDPSPLQALDDLSKFCHDFVTNRTLTRSKGRNPTDPYNETTNLLTVVGNTVQELVVQAQKDVVLEIYSPWCGNCAQFQPTYEKLALRLKDSYSTVAVAQLDFTINSTPKGYDVTEYPTIYFVPTGNAPIQYRGDRSLEDLLRFVKTHATVDMEL